MRIDIVQSKSLALFLLLLLCFCGTVLPPLCATVKDKCKLKTNEMTAELPPLLCHTIKISVTLHKMWWQLNCHWFWYKCSTALKVMFCKVTLS